MELDASKIDFENLQNYAEMLPNYAANMPIMQEKKTGCVVLVSAVMGKVVYLVI